MYRWDGASATHLAAQHGICVASKPETAACEPCRVVHFDHDPSLNVLQPDPNGEVRCVLLGEFLQIGTVVGAPDQTGARRLPRGTRLYFVPHSDRLLRQEVVARALWLLGRRGYHPLKRNSEHLANWCKTNIAESLQVWTFAGGALTVSLGVHGAGFALGGMPGLLAASAMMKATKCGTLAYAAGQDTDSLMGEVAKQWNFLGVALGASFGLQPDPANEPVHETCMSCGAPDALKPSSTCLHHFCKTCMAVHIRKFANLAVLPRSVAAVIESEGQDVFSAADRESATRALSSWRQRRCEPPPCAVSCCWEPWDCAKAILRHMAMMAQARKDSNGKAS